MKKSLKKFFKKTFIIISIFLACYGAVTLYNYIIQDATQKIQKSVTKGVLSAFNPLSWPGKIFGHKK